MLANWFTLKAKINSLCWHVWLLSKWNLLVLGPGFSAVWQRTDHFAFNKSTWFLLKIKSHIRLGGPQIYRNLKAFVSVQSFKKNRITATIRVIFHQKVYPLETEITTLWSPDYNNLVSRICFFSLLSFRTKPRTTISIDKTGFTSVKTLSTLRVRTPWEGWQVGKWAKITFSWTNKLSFKASLADSFPSLFSYRPNII